MFKFYLVYILMDVALLEKKTIFCPVTCSTDIIVLTYHVY